MRSSIVSVFVLGAFVQSACANAPAASPGTSAPVLAAGPTVQMALPSAEGALVTVPVAGAKATVVDFFGPTCQPCAKKLPELVAMKNEFAKKGAKIVLVAVLADGETTDAAKAALTKWGVSETFLVDAHEVSRAEAAIDSLPTTLVIDSAGRTLYRSKATSTASEALAAIP